MTILELMATMGIDTTAFNDGLSKAVESVEGLSDKTEELTTPSLGGNGQSSLKPLIDDAETVDAKLLEMQTKTKETSAVVEGFVSVIGEVVKDGIEAIIEFGAQSIEAAAATGSELANAFNESKSGFETSLDILKVKVGEALLPIATGFYEIGEALTGMTDLDKMHYIGQQLQNYSDLNLQGVTEQVGSLFSMFEQLETVEPGNLADYQSGLQSQTEYWTRYAETLNSLKEKGVDPEFLGEIADGTAESLEALTALDAADTAGLENMLASYDALAQAQQAAAESMNSVQIATDEAAQALSDALAPLLTPPDGMESTETLAAWVAQKNVEALTETYPAIESMVNQINEKLSELGLGENALGLSGVEGEEPSTPTEEGQKLTVVVETIASEESEGNLQSTVDGYELQGEAVLYADPSSAGILQNYLDGLNLTATVALKASGLDMSGVPGHASGLDYVPRNDYLARLHEGEAVLTKAEATQWRAGEGRASAAQPIQVTVNVTQSSASVEDISETVLEAIDLARWRA